jgi:hypothetical protein
MNDKPDNIRVLAEVFQKLTWSEMMEVSEIAVDILKTKKGLTVKPEAIAEVFDALRDELEEETAPVKPARPSR